MRSVAIENPVAYISVSTTSRAPAAAALAIIGATRVVRRTRVLPHDVVLHRGDLHRASPFNRVTASSITSARLQHAKRTRGRPAVAVVVEDDVGHRDHAAAFGERPAEREPVALAERADVDGEEVGARRREHREARVGEPGVQAVALVAHVVVERAEVVVVETEADRDRVLERRRVHVGEELLDRAHRGDQLGGPAHPADLPPGERERLAARRDRERALAHPGQRRERDVLALEHEVLVDLVGHRDEVVLDAELRDHLELGAREHLAGRVVGRVQQQHAGTRRDRARELVGIERVVGRAQLHDAPLRARERDARGVRVVVRLERDDVVARLAQREDATRRWLRWRPR